MIFEDAKLIIYNLISDKHPDLPIVVGKKFIGIKKDIKDKYYMFFTSNYNSEVFLSFRRDCTKKDVERISIANYDVYQLHQLIEHIIGINQVYDIVDLEHNKLVNGRVDNVYYQGGYNECVSIGNAVDNNIKVEQLPDSLLDRSIFDFKLSTRLKNILSQININSVREFMAYSCYDYSKVKNVGKKVFLEIVKLKGQINENDSNLNDF